MRASNASTHKKAEEGESGRKKEKTTRKYISSEDVHRLKGNLKDCEMNNQAQCEEKLRADKSMSLFPLRKKIVTHIQTTESGKKMFAEICQRMFSEIISVFTEVAQMKNIKNSEKRALFSIKCSHALSVMY